ncbi:MAG: phospho-N-acetylmuramoyl-pentapeptide-transferase [Clostridium sp.]|nr:phospho-N-acetylmuramoyl-pentapeptide-transferase [Clostridium sp.]MCM1444384.1 phospho-N-acetylmuramoyl-pentapeptide-transferase [Candidatus Amulumruptor caecigallinarius]
MLLLAKSALALMVSFIITVVCGLIILPLLKKINARQTISLYLSNIHKKKQGVPTMGGLIFIIPTIVATIILLLLGKINFSSNLFLILFIFIAYALLGFIDDLLKIKRKNNIGLTEIQKLIGQIFIAAIFFILYINTGHDTIFDIHTLGISIDMGWFYGLFILLMLVASSNAVNITDGLDGLAGSLSTIAFLAFALISFGTTWITGSEDIGIFCFILVGSLMGFLIYNIYPAKVIMGDTGSLALGSTLAVIAILTSHEVTLIVVAFVFVIETLSCIIQMIAGRYFGKKVFLMAPLHHHFEKLGWHETDVVKLFIVFGIIFSFLGVTFSVWI